MATMIKGMVKDTKGITYGAPEMVERFYLPHRTGKLLPGELVDVQSYASIYKLDEEGLPLFAAWMNTVTLKNRYSNEKDKIKRVPPKADEIAKELATVKLPKKKNRTEPYIVEMPGYAGYGTMPTKLDNTTF